MFYDLLGDIGLSGQRSLKKPCMVKCFVRYFKTVCRRLPVVLPHQLVMKMPLISDSEIKQFWDHLSACNSPLAKVSENKTHYPLWIWGDEAQFRESGEEVLLITLGSILDRRTYSVEACFPVCILRSEAVLA